MSRYQNKYRSLKWTFFKKIILINLFEIVYWQKSTFACIKSIIMTPWIVWMKIYMNIDDLKLQEMHKQWSNTGSFSFVLFCVRLPSSCSLWFFVLAGTCDTFCCVCWTLGRQSSNHIHLAFVYYIGTGTMAHSHLFTGLCPFILNYIVQFYNIWWLASVTLETFNTYIILLLYGRSHFLMRQTKYSKYTFKREVYAKPRLSQVNVRQNLFATGRNFGFTCQSNFCQILLYIQWCDR